MLFAIIAEALALFSFHADPTADSTAAVDRDAPYVQQCVSAQDAAELGVIERTFRGQGRCSQVCPIMEEECESRGGTPGRCWCDEEPGGVTVAHIVCKD